MSTRLYQTYENVEICTHLKNPSSSRPELALGSTTCKVHSYVLHRATCFSRNISNNNGICLSTILECKHLHVLFARKYDFCRQVHPYVKRDAPSSSSTNWFAAVRWLISCGSLVMSAWFRLVCLSRTPVERVVQKREVIDTVVAKRLIACRSRRNHVAASTVERVCTILGEDGG